MVTSGDIVAITDEQTLNQQSVINTFYYIVTVIEAGITLLDMLLEFKDSVMDLMLPLQAAQLTHDLLIAENVTDGIDIDSLITDDVGNDAGAGPSLPSYVAAGIRLNVSNKTTRPGGKRIAGIGESRVTGNTYQPDGQGMVDALAAIEDQLIVVGAIAGDGLLTPIVVGRDEFGHLDLDRFSFIASASAEGLIRSQVSRRADVI